MKKEKTLNQYFESLPKDSRVKMQKIRNLILKNIPEAEEVISYRMPAFKLNKRILIYYAAWENHISLYPYPASVKEFKKELSKYRTSKGTIQFPLDKPMPYNLIKKIVIFRAKELM